MKRAQDSLLITVGLLSALALLAGIALASYVTLNRFAQSVHWVEHTHWVIQEVEEVLSQVTSAETAQRGYLLAGDESFLELYRAAREALPRALRSLREKTADPSQRQRTAALQELIERRLQLLEDGIRLRGKSVDYFRPDRERLRQGQAIMNQVREKVDDLRREERRLLAERSLDLERDRAVTITIIVVGNGAALLLLLFAFGVMRRQIEQRRAAEAGVRRYAEEVEDLYNNAPCGYHSLDVQGRFTQINDTELRWLGYERDELVGKRRLLDLLTEPSKARFERNFVLFKERGWLLDAEYDVVRKDGSILPVLLSATLVRDERGGYLKSRSTLFDITRRREAEQSLHRTNAFLDSILEHIPDMIFVKDAKDLRFVRFNKAGEELIGLPKEELIGKNDYDFFPAPQADAFVAKDREVLSGAGVVDIIEEPIDTKSQGRRLLHTKKIPIRDEGGEALYLLGISEDITERRRTERRILELNQALEARAAQLEASNRELESFSYSVSHDLRSPLRAIDGFSRILEEDYVGHLDGEARRLLSVIRDNSKRMSRLIDDLLAFSRLGRQPMSLTEIDMTALAHEALRELKPETEGKPAQISIGQLPASRGDAGLLRQVWLNLLSNAVKYSSTRARPLVEVTGWPDVVHTIYCIKDNGVGFDMKYSGKLFGVFQRLHAAEEFPGTGVGLAIVQRVVVRHGGRVWAEGALDQGAAFYFSLPGGDRNE